MQNKTNQVQKIVTPVLNRAAKWTIFVLNRVRVWNTSVAQLYPDFPILRAPTVQQVRLLIKNVRY